MSTPGIEREGSYKNTKSSSNVDYWYGGGDEAWPNLSTALSNIPSGIRPGKVFGVYQGGRIIEYWWPNSTEILNSHAVVKRVASNTIYATDFGVFSDGLDHINELQAAVDYATHNSYCLELPRGTIRISRPLKVATASTSVLPGLEASFWIKGAGPSRDTGNGGLDIPGTQIRLYAQNPTADMGIIELNVGIGYYAHFSDFSVATETPYDAKYGIVSKGIAHSQLVFERVHCNEVKICFGWLSEAGGANGEFASFIKCMGIASQRFFYMDQSAGQAYNHYFEHCYSFLKYDNSAHFEIGGGVNGYSLTLLEFNSGTIGHGSSIPYDDIQPITFIKTNGIDGNVNIIGGRNEHLTTIVDNRLNTFDGHGKITFNGVTFDGLVANYNRKFLKSVSQNGCVDVVLKDCIFKGDYNNRDKNFISTEFGYYDASMYLFERCHFGYIGGFSWMVNSGFKRYGTNIMLKECTYAVKDTGIQPMRLNKNLSFKDVFQYANLIVNPLFGSVNPVSWTFVSISQFLFFRTHPDPALAPLIQYSQAVQIGFNSAGKIYQDISGTDMSLNKTYYYKAKISASSNLSQVKIRLENNTSNRVYDEVHLITGDDTSMVIDIDLAATDNTPGMLRLVIESLGFAVINVIEQTIK